MTDELVDIVDDDDAVIATVTRAEMRARRLQHRAVGILVLSSDGRLLIHRRSPDKDIWPGWWDIAAGGVVTAGESYESAARRELAEELGLADVDPSLPPRQPRSVPATPFLNLVALDVSDPLAATKLEWFPVWRVEPASLS